MNLPIGTVTFLFTDIEGSTRLWRAHGAAMEHLLPKHDAVLREHIEKHAGYVFKTGGDSFCAAFHTAEQAAACAVEVQLALVAADLNISPVKDSPAIRVRMAVHSGQAALRDGDYFGASLSTVARAMEAAHGGQTLITLPVRALLQGSSPCGSDIVDLGVHRLRDIGSEHLFQLCPPKLEREFPALRTLDLEVNRLPLPMTPLIGRAAITRQVAELLAEADKRVVTLTGFGGIGKSRVALHVAERCAENYADGVWWIDLAATNDADGAMTEIARQMQMRIQADIPLERQLLEFLQPKQRLLVLDNAEQISGLGALIGRTLVQAGRTQYLITSRRALDIRSEYVVEIGPLLPDEAERLFLDRARSRSSSFSVETANGLEINKLCDRLENLPLAIELAATRVPAMSIPEISSRLGERFKLLRASLADLPARQQAMRVTIEWSYNLLSAEVQVALSQMSLFSGPFSATDTEAICGSWEAIDSLLELRNQSLLKTQVDANAATTWYSMFESVRAFAYEKLAEDPNISNEAKRRFAEHYRTQTADLVGSLRTEKERSAVAAAEKALPNLRSSLAYAVELGDAELYASLSNGLVPFFQYFGLMQEASRMCVSARELLEKQTITGHTATKSRGKETPMALRQAMLHWQASIAHDFGEMDQAAARASDALAVARAMNSPERLARSLNLVGVLGTERNNHTEALAAFEAARRIRERIPDAERGNILHNLARLTARTGDAARAQELYEEALSFRQRAGDSRGVAETLGNLGILAFHAADYKDARRLYLESLHIYQKLEYAYGIGVELSNLAEIDEIDCDFETAAVLFAHAERILKEHQYKEAGVPAEGLTRVGGMPDVLRSWEEVVGT